MTTSLFGGADGVGGGEVRPGVRCLALLRACVIALAASFALMMPVRAGAEEAGARKISSDALLVSDAFSLPSVLGRAEIRLAAAFERASVSFPPESVTLIALKREGRLEVWARDPGARVWSFVRSYGIRASSGALGPKLRQGDHQVPEGIYRVTALNPNSIFHLSLRLDYPNAFDRAHAAADGRSRLGGDIMIHGGRASDGCVPVGDEASEDLFALARLIGPDRISVIISPADLRTRSIEDVLAQSGTRIPWLGELYTDVAFELRGFVPPWSAEAQRGASLEARRVRCAAYDAKDCRKKCEKGDVASCARAGLMYRDGRGTIADEALAWSLLSRACAAGDAFGCAELSALYLEEDADRRDVGHAYELARAACDAGDGHGCAYVARICHGGMLYPDDRRACSQEAVDAMRVRAVAHLGGDCRDWHAYDCATLSEIYADGDTVTATRFAAGSCEAGDPGGCYVQARLAEKAMDGKRAYSLYRAACKAGFVVACERYAFAP